MSAYVLPLPGGREARVYMTHAPSISHVHALVFGPNAETLADIPAHGFSLFCVPEMIGHTLADAVTAGVLTNAEIDDALTARFGASCVCPCECDDAECSDCHPNADDTNGADL